jgi:hypothetical protein
MFWFKDWRNMIDKLFSATEFNGKEINTIAKTSGLHKNQVLIIWPYQRLRGNKKVLQGEVC